MKKNRRITAILISCLLLFTIPLHAAASEGVSEDAGILEARDGSGAEDGRTLLGRERDDQAVRPFDAVDGDPAGTEKLIRQVGFGKQLGQFRGGQIVI